MDTVPTKILVTLDGSPVAEAVLPYVRLLAARLRIPVELISVIDLTELARSAAAYESLFLDQLAEDETRRRREYLEKIAPSFANGQIDCRILKGNPASSIVEYAAQNPAAIIAMATHGIITRTNYGDSLIPTYGRLPKTPGSSCRLSRGTKCSVC